jgi:hypothetical protein
MSRSERAADEPGYVDPDGDPEMKQSVGQPDQAEGADDRAETGSP